MNTTIWTMFLLFAAGVTSVAWVAALMHEKGVCPLRGLAGFYKNRSKAGRIVFGAFFAVMLAFAGSKPGGGTPDPDPDPDPDPPAPPAAVCIVDFAAAGGDTSEPRREVEKNAKIGELPAAARKGYKFKGWYTAASGGTKIKATTTVKKDVTYYAQWTANKYTIKFDKNGGTGSMKSISATYGKSVALTANAFKRTNYSFLGWATKKDAKEAKYANKKKVKNLTASNGKTVTLYAVWKRNSYTVTFDANGGSGTLQDQTVNCGEKTALAKNTYKREGFTFAGWTTKKDGSVAYKNKAKVKDLAKNGKSVPLYAVWKPAAWAVGTFNGTGQYIVDAWSGYRPYDFIHTATVGAYGKFSGSVTVDVSAGKQEKATFSASSAAMKYEAAAHLELWREWDSDRGWVADCTYDGPAYFYDVKIKLHGVVKTRRLYVCDMAAGTFCDEEVRVEGVSKLVFGFLGEEGGQAEVFDGDGDVDVWKSKAYKGPLPKFSSSSLTKKASAAGGDVCTFTLKQDGGAAVKIKRADGSTDSASFTMRVAPVDGGKWFAVSGSWIFPKGSISSVEFKLTPNSKGVVAAKNVKVVEMDVDIDD